MNKIFIEGDLGPLLHDRFHQIPLPGRGDAIAVIKEVSLEYAGAVIVLGERGATVLWMKGDPLRETRRSAFGLKDARAARSLLSHPVMRPGMVCAADVLDGEGYLVKWRVDGEEFCLVIGNPRLMDDPTITDFVKALDRLLRRRRWW